MPNSQGTVIKLTEKAEHSLASTGFLLAAGSPTPRAGIFNLMPGLRPIGDAPTTSATAAPDTGTAAPSPPAPTKNRNTRHPGPYSERRGRRGRLGDERNTSDRERFGLISAPWMTICRAGKSMRESLKRWQMEMRAELPAEARRSQDDAHSYHTEPHSREVTPWRRHQAFNTENI